MGRLEVNIGIKGGLRMKKKLIVLGILIEATTTLAYHGTERGASNVEGALPGWAILLILAVMCFLLYLGWRWWKNLNESAYKKQV